MFKALDIEIVKISEKFGCTYTRYSDDMTFSVNSFDRDKAKKLISEISTVLSKNGFRRNMNKTHIVPPGARKIVTGLIVNSSIPKIKQSVKRNIENHLYYATKFGVQSHCRRREFKSIMGFRNHLRGLIDYVYSIEKSLGSSYLEKFFNINWPELL